MRIADAVERILGAPVPTGPSRTFAITALMGSTGNGIFAASAVLFFTRAVGTNPTQASIALTIAGAVAIAGNTVVGAYADRASPVHAMLGLCLARAVVYGVLAAVSSYAQLVPIMCLALTLDLANQPVKQALMRSVLSDEERRISYAIQRTIINIAFVIGASIAGVVISLDSELGFRLLIVVNAILFLPMIVMYRGLHQRTRADVGDEVGSADAEDSPVPETASASPWRNRQYVTFSVASGVLTVADQVLFFGLPLWIAGHTDAPLAMVSVVLVSNCVVVAVSQARWAQKLVGLGPSGKGMFGAGATFAAACVAFLLAESGGPLVAATWILAGGLFLSVGESLRTSAEWEISVGLAPVERQAHYFSVTSSFGALSETLGPLMIAALILPQPTIGWLALGGLFLLAGAVGRAVVTRPPDPAVAPA